MASPIAVETSKPKAQPKVLAHVEIHPQMGGGHIVKHVYTSYSHEPKTYSFNKNGVAKGGEHIAAHLTKHAGLPAYSKQDHSATEEEVEA